MANPAILAGGSIAASGIGAIVNALGSSYTGQSQANLFNYQAGLAQQNAALAKQDANYSIGEGEVETQKAGLSTRAEIGATRAGFGASNVDVNSGSSSRVISSETEIGQENEAVTAANAAKRAYGFGIKAAQDTAQSNIYQTAASTSKTAGTLGAVSSIIGGVGSVSSKWLQYGQSFGSGGGGGGNQNYFGNVGGDQFSWYGG